MCIRDRANTNWERPLYMAITVGSDNHLNLGNNFMQEGLAYRITPFNTTQLNARIDSEKMYPVTKAALIQRKQDLTASHAPATFNSMLAAVNGFFAFLGWWGLAVKLLKIQKSPFCDEGKELTRAEYARLVRAAERRENERLSLVIQTICATGIRVSELRFITVETVQAGRRSATRASGGSCSCPTSCGGCCRNISGRKKRPLGRCSPPRRASRWTNRTPGGT